MSTDAPSTPPPPPIDRLTPEQEARLAAFRAKWLAHGLSTEPADRPRAEAAITRMYQAIGAEQPAFLWFHSPASAMLGIHVLKQLGDQLWDQLGDQLRDQLGDQLRVQLRDQLWDQLWGQLGDQLRDQLGDQLGGQLWGQRIPYENSDLWGAHESYWVAFYLFGREIGASYTPQSAARLDWHAEICQSALWWWPYQNVCVVSDRPAEVHMADGRLHRTDGPAVRFRDGWSLYAIGGVQVDEQIVMHPETQTLDQIRDEANAEVKRIRIERYGWPRYLSAIGATVLDERRNDIEATLEVLMRTPDDLTILVCSCPSTARTYALEVPPETTTCLEAQHWLSGGLAERIINAA